MLVPRHLTVRPRPPVRDGRAPRDALPRVLCPVKFFLQTMTSHAIKFSVFYHTSVVSPKRTVVCPDAQTSQPKRTVIGPANARTVPPLPHAARTLRERALLRCVAPVVRKPRPPPQPPSATWSALLWPSAVQLKPYRGRPHSAPPVVLRGCAAATVAALVPREHAHAGDGRRSSTLAAARDAHGDDWWCIGEPMRGGRQRMVEGGCVGARVFPLPLHPCHLTIRLDRSHDGQSHVCLVQCTSGGGRCGAAGARRNLHSVSPSSAPRRPTTLTPGRRCRRQASHRPSAGTAGGSVPPASPPLTSDARACAAARSPLAVRPHHCPPPAAARR